METLNIRGVIDVCRLSYTWRCSIGGVVVVYRLSLTCRHYIGGVIVVCRLSHTWRHYISGVAVLYRLSHPSRRYIVDATTDAVVVLYKLNHTWRRYIGGVLVVYRLSLIWRRSTQTVLVGQHLKEPRLILCPGVGVLLNTGRAFARRRNHESSSCNINLTKTDDLRHNTDFIGPEHCPVFIIIVSKY